MTYSPSNNYTKNYYNRTLTVQVIVEDVVTWIFLRHSVLGESRVMPHDTGYVSRFFGQICRADSNQDHSRALHVRQYYWSAQALEEKTRPAETDLVTNYRE